MKHWSVLIIFFLAICGLVTPQPQAFARAFKTTNCFTKGSASAPGAPRSTQASDPSKVPPPAAEEEESHASHEHAQPGGNAVLASDLQIHFWLAQSRGLPPAHCRCPLSVALSEPTPPPEVTA